MTPEERARRDAADKEAAAKLAQRDVTVEDVRQAVREDGDGA